MSPSVPQLYFAKALAVTGSLQIHHHLSRDPLHLPRFVTAVFPEFEVTFWLFLLQLSTTGFQLVQRVEIYNMSGVVVLVEPKIYVLYRE